MRLLSNNRIALIMLLSFSLLMGAGCREAVKSLSDLSALRSELMREYKEEDVEVVIQNSRVLGITFHNSAFNKLREAERGSKAREIALFAKRHYGPIDSVDKIWVAFVVTTNYIVFRYTDGLGTYLFEKSSLEPAAKPVEAGPQGDVIASYNPSLNQTLVYLRQNLRLSGDSQSNVMLLPHFILAGNNAKAPRLPVPESVTLDFTSYSDKRMFPDAPQLVIYADGRKVFYGTARLTKTLGSEAEKSVNEFLTQEISYSQFLPLTNCKKIRIALGSKQFELSGKQLAALQSMRKCVEELRCS
jgi:hypothetical protein